MMSDKFKGEHKVETLLHLSLPTRIKAVADAYENGYGCAPERITMTQGLHAKLVTEFPDYLLWLEKNYTIVAFYVPLKDSWTNAVLIVSNDSGTKEMHI